MSKTFLYLRGDLKLKSPLKLSSGGNDFTDSDVLADSEGVPFIPGTALAGVMRHYLDATNGPRETRCLTGDNGKREVDLERPYSDMWFGFISNPRKGEPKNVWCDSRAVVYDAFPKDKTKPVVTTRDGVALDDFKVAKDGKKYDYQVVEAGAVFRLRIRIDATVEDADNDTAEKPAKKADELVKKIVSGFKSGDIRVGGKTTRGFGELEIENAETRTICTSDVDDYAGFSWDGEGFKPLDDIEDARELYECFGEECSFDIRSFLMIRDYGTVIKSGHEDKLVDAEPLKNASDKPVVPGTSWAGLFRHHMHHILRRAGKDEEWAKGFLDMFFGDLGSEDARATISLVEFSESVVEGSTQMNITRNAVDRFTGGAAYQKLFTNRLACGGRVKLKVRLRKLDKIPADRELKNDEYELFKSLIKVTLDDIGSGYAAIGGMTSVGGGMLRARPVTDATEGE